MRQISLYVEVSDIRADSCEILVVGTDMAGQTCVIDAEQTPWPIQARPFRAMMDASRRWMMEAVPE